MKRLLLTCLVALGSAAAYCADNGLPENGFRAEQEGRWEDAVSIYRDALKVNQDQLAIWLRLADIHAHLKQYGQAADALDHATRLNPTDPALWKRLSQARAVADDKEGAYTAIGRAVELAPDNLDYLRAQAQLALWANHNAVALAAYRKLLVVAPEDATAWLGLARINAWSGQTDDAVHEYRAYLEHKPDDKAVWLELVKTEGWRGNYPQALTDLDLYRTRFGDDTESLAQRARALAWLGKSTEAIDIARGLLKAQPQDTEVLATRLVALNQANRFDEALADLQTIATLRPDSKETASLRQYLLNPQRSFVRLGMNYSTDSSDLHIFPVTLDGELALSSRTRLTAGVESQRLDGVIGSGLENINGGTNADYRRVWGGVIHRFSPTVAGELRLGGANADSNHQFTEYRVALDLRPSEDWTLRPEAERTLHAVSPRAASLPIERETVRLQSHWTPGVRYVVDASLSHDNYSDGNSRWEVVLSPRRAILRTQSLNMDVGVSGTWSGFAKNLDNGYYDPAHFRRYALTSVLYWKLSDDNGVSLALSLGAQKDDSMADYKMGGDAVVQGHFGINRDWYLRVYGSLMHNVQAPSGAYRNNNLGFVLTRRF